MGLSELLMEPARSEEELDLILVNLDRRRLYSGTPSSWNHPDISTEELILKMLAHGERPMLLIPPLLARYKVDYDTIVSYVKDNPELAKKLYGILKITSYLFKKEGLVAKACEVSSCKDRLRVKEEEIDQRTYALFETFYLDHKKPTFSISHYRHTNGAV